MKKFILVFAFLVGAFNIADQNIEAQNIRVSVNVNSQPAWGPVGYDYVDYYYMPDIDVYYSLNTRNFIYLDRGRWISARYLPSRYRDYDLYRMYKVVMVGSRDPWLQNRVHYGDYKRYRNNRRQAVIRDSRDSRYNASRVNYNPWYRDERPRDNKHHESRPVGRQSDNKHHESRPANRPNDNKRPTNKERSTTATRRDDSRKKIDTAKTRNSSRSSQRSGVMTTVSNR